MLRVVFLDPNATPLSLGSTPRQWMYAIWARAGAVIQEINVNTPADSAVYDDDWDCIVVPAVDSIAGNYTNLQTHLSRFTDAAIPVYVGQAKQPQLASAITGASAVAGADSSINCGALKDWHGSATVGTRHTFYGRFPTLAGLSGVTVHADDGTSCALWSNTVSGHPVLWQAGTNLSLSSGYTSNYRVIKPWLGMQWMIDNKPATAAKIEPLYLILRYDGIEQTTDDAARSAGYLDTCYDYAVASGVTEIFLAAMWSGTYGATYPTTASWFEARGKHNGGLYRCANHLSDPVDGTTGGADSKCTSNGVLFDQFSTALSVYSGHCDQLTARGWDVGTDGYGAGFPFLANGNDMNHPAAKFLAENCGVSALWLLMYQSPGASNKTYPSGTGATNAAKADYLFSWAGLPLIYGFSMDPIDPATVANTARSLNGGVLNAMTLGGGVYVHGSSMAYMAGGTWQELCDVFRGAPDVVKSGLIEDLVERQKRGHAVCF